MHELTNLDLVIIVLYMIGMLFVGVWFVKRIKNTGDYYVAGRTLGPFVLTATVCASIIGGSAMMGRAGIAYTTGFKAVMTAIPYLIGMFIFSAIAGRIQEVGFTRNINSIPELFNYRFNSTARCILAFMIVFTMMGTVAAQVTATATIIKMLGNEFGISYEAGALAATLIFIIYTAASGLFGVVYTDVLPFPAFVIWAVFPPSGRTWTNPTWCLISTAVSWATLSPIWYLPWQEPRCGRGPLLLREKRPQPRACSGALPFTW